MIRKGGTMRIKNIKNYCIAVLSTLLLLMLLLLSGCRDVGENGVVYVYSYGDYYDPAIVEKFEEQTGITVIQDTYDTAEEMYPVIKNNSAEYDVVCTSDYMIGKMISEGLLATLNKENITNLKNIDPVYMSKSEEFDPGNLYSVPHTFGVAGIAYDSKAVKGEKIDSWSDLWNEKFKGNIVMPDSLRDGMMIGLLKLGYSHNTTEEIEIKAAAHELMIQKPLVYKYANDSARDLLADGSAIIGVMWNGEYVYTHKLNKDVKFTVPEEGSESFIDSWVIPQKAKNKKNAEKWINFLCEAEIAKQNFDYLHYTTPNMAAKNLISRKYTDNEAVFPAKKTLDRCSGLKTLNPAADALYSKYWKQVKAQ